VFWFENEDIDKIMAQDI